jgi:hypothetical protein
MACSPVHEAAAADRERVSAFAGHDGPPGGSPGGPRSARVSRPRRPFARWLALFTLLSGLDLALTWWLVGDGAGLVYEANPLIDWLLQQHGWTGVLLVKGGTVLLLGSVCACLARHRPRAAVRVLTLASVAVGVVVGYSAALAAHVQPWDGHPDLVDLREAEHDSRTLKDRLHASVAYRARVRLLARDLATGRRTLPDAAAALARSEELRTSGMLTYLHVRFGNRPDLECLAATLIEFALLDHRDCVAARRLSIRLHAEFLTTYGAYPPPNLKAIPLT